MTHPNDERDERVRQIRENLADGYLGVYQSDSQAAFGRLLSDARHLLSLLDSQPYEVNEVDAERLADYHKIGSMPAIVKSVDYGAVTLAECVEKAVDRFYERGRIEGGRNAATRMRDLCLAKVRDALLDHAVGCGNALYCDCGTAANRRFLIELLESLTLEQGEQEKPR